MIEESDSAQIAELFGDPKAHIGGTRNESRIRVGSVPLGKFIRCGGLDMLGILKIKS